jgi:hypothetical protein
VAESWRLVGAPLGFGVPPPWPSALPRPKPWTSTTTVLPVVTADALAVVAAW